MDVAEWTAIAVGVFGLAGVVFTAMKFNRDDTTAVVGQQTQILTNMKTLNEELRLTAKELRDERDSLKSQVASLTGQVELLRTELNAAHARTTGQLTRIQDKLDESTG